MTLSRKILKIGVDISDVNVWRNKLYENAEGKYLLEARFS
jgi:hypothetical protein